MTHWLRKYSKAILFFAFALLLSSCNPSHSKDAEDLLDSIKGLQGSNYASLPASIEKYNIIRDSLETIDNRHCKELNKYLLNGIGTDNDTLLIATHLIIQNPTIMGKWFGEYLSNIAFDTKGTPPAKRSEIISQQLNIARYLYKMSGEPSSIVEMETSIDNYINNLCIHKRVLLFTIMSSPEELAQAIIEPADSLLIPAIQKAYATNSDNLKRFNDALATAQSIKESSNNTNLK